MRFTIFSLAAAMTLCAAFAHADPWHGPGPGPYMPGHPHHGWHGDIHHFHDHDLVVWRGGRWFHGPHGGQDGWWWIVGGVWYFYPVPVYPYPDPYVPPQAAIAPPAPAPVWYYCNNPQGYYPYVPACRHWMAVPANP